MHTTSMSLIERLRRSDETEAWSQFVRTYSPILYSWARLQGLDGDDAADLVQDVFITLIKKLPAFTYDPNRGFRNWLWVVLRNQFLDRARRRAGPASRADLDTLAADPIDDPVEQADFRNYVVSRLVPAMKERFQPATWQAFWEHVVAGKTAARVAAELGTSIDTVYKAKVRVLARLNTEFAGLMPLA